MSGDELTVEPETTQERKLSETCGRRYCERETVEELMVPIYVGDTSEKWCLGCVNDEFGLDYAQYKSRSPVWRYVTAKTVTAFLLGMTVMLVVASVMVV